MDCWISGWEIGSGVGQSFLPGWSVGRGYYSFSEPSPHKATEPAGRYHIWDSINLAHTVYPGDSLRPNPAPPNFQGHPSCFQWLFPMNDLSWSMLQIFLTSLKQATSGLSERCTSHLVAPGLSLAAAGLGSQLGLAWPPPSPAQEVAFCRSLCSLCCETLNRIQAVADLGHANGKQSSATMGGCTQLTQWAPLEYPAWVVGEAVPLDSIRNILH